MKFKEGDQVVVLGKLNTRIRDQLSDGLIKGTIFCLVRVEDAEVAVTLENGDIWLGKLREIRSVKEQE